MNEDAGAIVSGGYFLTRAVERPPCMSADLLPERVLSLSSCIADFVPDYWAVAWAGIPQEDRQAEARKVGIPVNLLSDVISWTTAQLEAGEFGWPCVFLSVGAARDFTRRFPTAMPGLRMLGLGLSLDTVDRFLDEARPELAESSPGVYRAIGDRAEMARDGVPLGWEMLCYDLGEFHSWLCNGLETEVAETFGIAPNAAGFIASAEAAVKAAEFCGREDVASEPGLWLPWLVMEYPL